MEILVVENDEVFARSIRRIFSEHVFSIVLTVDDAIRYVKSNKAVDCVFLDLRLNGKYETGFDVYECIRRHWGKEVPIVVITGCLDDLLMKAEMIEKEDSFFFVVRKPVDIFALEKVFDRISNLLELKNVVPR